MSTGVTSLELVVRPAEPSPTLFSVELGPSLLAGALLVDEASLSSLGESFGLPVAGPAGPGGGTTDHRALGHRGDADQHPATAVSVDDAALDYTAADVQEALVAEKENRETTTNLFAALFAAMPETIRDTLAAAFVAGTGITLVVNDPGDTITISASGGGGTDTDTVVGYARRMAIIGGP